MVSWQMVKTNQDIIDEYCIRNYDSVLAVSDEDKKKALKSYHEKLWFHARMWNFKRHFYLEMVTIQTLSKK